jgi:hypothetical protein
MSKTKCMCKVKLAGIIHHGIVYIANKGHSVMNFFQDLLQGTLMTLTPGY